MLSLLSGDFLPLSRHGCYVDRCFGMNNNNNIFIKCEVEVVPWRGYYRWSQRNHQSSSSLLFASVEILSLNRLRRGPRLLLFEVVPVELPCIFVPGACGGIDDNDVAAFGGRVEIALYGLFWPSNRAASAGFAAVADKIRALSKGDSLASGRALRDV